MFNATTPLVLRRRDDDDDYDDDYPPSPPAAPPTSLRRELAKLAVTTLVTASVTKLVEHLYGKWSYKKDDKNEEKST